MKTYVKLLVEVAMGVDSAVSDGYALYSNDYGRGQTALLYDPEHVWRVSSSGKLPQQSAGPVIAYINTRRRENIKGHMYGARAIASAAARKGWGPMLYDFIISSAKVAPDRLSVSSSAESVWSYYKNKRSDVEKEKIDNVLAPKTPTPVDDGEVYDKGSDENPLNYVYSMKSDITGQYSPLLKSHSEFCDRMQQKRGISRDDLEAYLKKCGSMFFMKKYEG